RIRDRACVAGEQISVQKVYREAKQELKRCFSEIPSVARIHIYIRNLRHKYERASRGYVSLALLGTAEKATPGISEKGLYHGQYPHRTHHSTEQRSVADCRSNSADEPAEAAAAAAFAMAEYSGVQDLGTLSL